MVKVIEIRLSDEKYKEFHGEVGEIVGLAAFMEAEVRIYPSSLYGPTTSSRFMGV